MIRSQEKGALSLIIVRRASYTCCRHFAYIDSGSLKPSNVVTVVPTVVCLVDVGLVAVSILMCTYLVLRIAGSSKSHDCNVQDTRYKIQETLFKVGIQF